MKKFTLPCLALCMTSVAIAAQPPAQPLLLEHANVVTMLDEQVLIDRSVLVRDGRIVAVGQNLPAPADAIRVDARDKFLLPGLTDMHAHFASAKNITDAAIRDEMLLYVANGVTTIRNAAGAPRHLRTREQTASGEILGPRIFTAGPILESRPSFPQLADGDRFHQLQSPAEAAAEVRREKAAGYDFIKLYNQIDSAVYEAVIQTSKEVGMPYFGHVSIEPGLAAAFKNHHASVEHLRGYDLELSANPKSIDPEIRFGGWPSATDAALDALVKRTLDAGMWNVPTLMVPRAVELTPEIRSMGVDYAYVPAHLYAGFSRSVLASYYSERLAQLVRDGLPAQCRLAKKLIDAGAPVMAGTDALVPGIAMHGEVRAIAACGVSNFQALRAATETPGRWFAKYKPEAAPFGTVAVGKAAELVLYDANPLVDLANLERISGVVAQGRWLGRQELDQRLDELQKRNAPELAKLKAAIR